MCVGFTPSSYGCCQHFAGNEFPIAIKQKAAFVRLTLVIARANASGKSWA
jgi:hypothetical protein